jgi:hypothetical protein
MCGVLKQTATEEVGVLSGELSELVDEGLDRKTLKEISTPRQAPRVTPLSTGT